MIDTVKHFFSVPFVIIMTLVLLFLFYLTGTEANPLNALGPAVEPIKIGFMELSSLGF